MADSDSESCTVIYATQHVFSEDVEPFIQYNMSQLEPLIIAAYEQINPNNQLRDPQIEMFSTLFAIFWVWLPVYRNNYEPVSQDNSFSVDINKHPTTQVTVKTNDIIRKLVDVLRKVLKFSDDVDDVLVRLSVALRYTHINTRYWVREHNVNDHLHSTEFYHTYPLYLSVGTMENAATIRQELEKDDNFGYRMARDPYELASYYNNYMSKGDFRPGMFE